MQFFLSYPSDDREAAEMIRDGLVTLGHRVWVRYEDITDDIRNSLVESIKIQEGVESADVFIALLTQEDISSDQEPLIVYAKHRHIPIIPLVFFRGEGRSGVVSSPYSLIDYEALTIREDHLAEGLKGLVDYAQGLIQNIHKDEVTQSELDSSRERILDNKSSSSQIRIFIAYSHYQRPLAKALSDLLYKNGKSNFYDAKITAGARWRQKIQKALDDATHLIVIWTSNAAESNEVEREVSYALAEGKVIIPLLSKDIPKLPYHLHGLHYIILEEDLGHIEQDLLKAIAQFSSEEDIWQ